MFERFSREARKALAVASLEAQHQQADAVRPDHLLLGILHGDPGLALQALAALDVDLDDLGRRTQPTAAPSAWVRSDTALPIAPSTKQVLELAFREAVALHPGRHVGTAHLLLAIVRHGDNQGAHVLAEVGVGLDSLRRAVLELSPPQVVPDQPPVMGRSELDDRDDAEGP